MSLPTDGTTVPARVPRPLHKASSLVLNNPAAPALVTLVPNDTGAQYVSTSKSVAVGADCVVPDSEEEWLRSSRRATARVNHTDRRAVIEILSSDDEVSIKSVTRGSKGKRKRRIVKSASSEASDTEADSIYTQRDNILQAPHTPLFSHTVIDLTEDSPNSDLSEYEDPGKASLQVQLPPVREHAGKPSVAGTFALEQPASSLYADDSDDGPDRNDGSILIFNEPPSARKPIRHADLFSPGGRGISFTTPLKQRTQAAVDQNLEFSIDARVSKKTPAPTPQKAGRTPRMSKKALAEIEQARRVEYARSLFEELNRTVFDGGLPPTTQLIWSKRLLTTAGKARWHNAGVHSTEIQLAEKILDCDERIRNTLSHEMCHLACWIISEDPKEVHGHIFQGWAKKVMRTRPDIEVTLRQTRHNYEITYKYEWKCQDCDKIYGRHSKSIRPDECVCGVCKKGKLIPLFQTRTPRTPRNKADSQLAATKSRDSPITVSSPSTTLGVDDSPIRTRTRFCDTIVLTDDSDNDPEEGSDVEVLTHILGAVKI